MGANARTRVTIGLPVYNGRRYLPQAIDALLGQTYREFALVISDNASTDGTEEICREYATRDPRISYHRNARNIGLSANFNRVFALANSEYFKWATADDYVSADMLAEALAVLESEPSVVLCYPKAILLDESSGALETYDDPLALTQEDPVERFKTYLMNVRLCHYHQGLIRSSAIRRTGMLRAHVGSDIDFLAELSLHGKFRETSRSRLFRRFHPDSSSWRRGSVAHQARRYHAAGVRRVLFNEWKRHLTRVSGVFRSPCSVRQKTRLLGFLAHSMYWNKSELAGEAMRDSLRGMRWGARP